MKTAEQGGNAFPTSELDIYRGMTLRDYFAAKALPTVMVQADNQNIHTWPVWCQKVAASSYEIADAMIARRQRSVP